MSSLTESTCRPRSGAIRTTSADKELQDLIGELSTRSECFRQLWAAHDVKYHRTGVKLFHHPLVGDLTLDFEAFELPSDEGQRLNVYTAAPDSPAAERVRP